MLEKLEDFYLGAEEKFYDFVDFVSEKGIPLDKATDFLDSKGIPAFPSILAIILLLAGGIFLAFTSMTIDSEINFSLTDEYGEPLQSVKITIVDSTGNILESKTISHNSSLKLEGIQNGLKLIIKAEKEDYTSDEIEVYAVKTLIAKLALESNTELGTGKVKVIDSKGLVIAGAKVQLEKTNYLDTSWTENTGIAEFEGAPLNTKIDITVSADGYKTSNIEAKLRKNETYSVTLEYADSGELQGDNAKLIVLVKDSYGNLINGADITAYNYKNDLIIDNKETENGRAVLTIGYGKEVRLVIEKEDYSIYDDSTENTVFTMDSEEKTIERVLIEGQYDLEVFVKNSSGQAIEDAVVILYNSLGEEQSELIGSQVKFENLNNGIYFIGASAYGFLSSSQEVLGDIGAINITLTPADTSNSSYIPIFVEDYEATPVINAKINVWQSQEDGEVPYPIDDTYSDLGGAATVRLEYDKTYRIEAKTEESFGSTYITPISSSDNTVRIIIYNDLVLREVDIRNNGLPVSGTITITSEDGLLEREVEFTDGKASFYAKDGEKIEIVSGDNSYSFTMGSETDLEIDIATNQTAKIEFLGAYYNGKKVESLSPDYEYELRFEVETKGISGAFIRLGDSENIEDEEFSLYCENCRMGKTYTNDEYYDRARATSRNGKWAEFEFESGKRILKIKLKIQDSFEGEIPVYYRVWAINNSAYTRDPYDSELGTEKQVTGKQGMYAESYSENLVVLRKEGQCNEEFCINYFFDSQEYKEEGDFWTTIGAESKLVTEVLALKDGLFNQTVSGNNINFDSIVDYTNSGYTGETSSSGTTQNNFSLTKGEIKNFVYTFTSEEKGNASIKIKSKMNKSLEKEIDFTVYTDNSFNILMDTFIKPTTRVEVKLKAEKEIEDALIQVYNSGELVYSLEGNGRLNKGKNSEYVLKYNFIEGEYKITFTAKGFEKQEKSLLVTKDGILVMPEKLEYYLSKDSIESLEIENISKLDLEDLEYWVEVIDNAELDLSLSLPSVLKAESKESLNLNIDLKDETEDTGVYDLYIKGNLGSVEIQEKTRISIYKNQKLDSSCLKTDKERLLFTLAGETGTKTNGELTFTNYCNQNLSFNVSNSLANEGITINQTSFSIIANETKTFAFEIENTGKKYTDKASTELNGSLVFTGEETAKEIGMQVFIINPIYNIAVPSTISLWPIYNATTKTAFDSKKISLTNKGQYPVSNIRMTFVGSVPSYLGFYSSTPSTDTTIKTNAEANIGYIEAGEKNESQYLQVNYKDNKAIQKDGSVGLWGTVNGKNVLIGKIPYNVNYSGIDCLKIDTSKSDKLEFISETLGTTQSKTIYLKNECKETVRIFGLNPSEISGNSINISNITLQTDQEQAVKVTMNIKEYSEDSRNIIVQGSLVQTGNTVNLPLTIKTKISAKQGQVAEGLKTNPIELKVCEDTTDIISVAFPKSSSTCTSGYCEGSELAKVLGKTLDTIEKNVITYTKRLKPSNFPDCKNDICTFKQIGLEQEKINIYFKHDTLSPPIIEKETDYSVITNNLFDKERNLQSTNLGTEMKQIFYPETIQNCGNYEINIDGIIRIEGDKFATSSSGISFEVTIKEYKDTEECERKINNITNFIITGKGVDTTEDLGLNLSTIYYADNQTSNKLIAQTISYKMFGTKLRTSNGSKKNNFEVILGGNAPYRVKLDISKIQGQEDSFRIHVDNSAQDWENIGKNEADFAAAVLKSLKEGGLHSDSCISRDLDYIGFNKALESAAIEINTKNNQDTLYFNHLESNLDFEIKTKGNFNLTMSIDIPTFNQNDFPELKLQEKDSQGKWKDLETIVTETTELSIKVDKTKELRLVANGGIEFGYKNDSKATISLKLEGEEATTKEIEIKKCRTSLSDFIKFFSNNMKQEGLQKNYAYLGWEPNKIAEQTQVADCLSKYNISKTGGNDLEITTKTKVARAAGASAYALTCMATFGLADTLSLKGILKLGFSGGWSGILTVISTIGTCITPAIGPITDLGDSYGKDNDIPALSIVSTIIKGVSKVFDNEVGRFLFGINEYEEIDFDEGLVDPEFATGTRYSAKALTHAIPALLGTETSLTTAGKEFIYGNSTYVGEIEEGLDALPPKTKENFDEFVKKINSVGGDKGVEEYIQNMTQEELTKINTTEQTLIDLKNQLTPTKRLPASTDKTKLINEIVTTNKIDYSYLDELGKTNPTIKAIVDDLRITTPTNNTYTTKLKNLITELDSTKIKISDIATKTTGRTVQLTEKVSKSTGDKLDDMLKSMGLNERKKLFSTTDFWKTGFGTILKGAGKLGLQVGLTEIGLYLSNALGGMVYNSMTDQIQIEKTICITEYITMLPDKMYVLEENNTIENCVLGLEIREFGSNDTLDNKLIYSDITRCQENAFCDE